MSAAKHEHDAAREREYERGEGTLRLLDGKPPVWVPPPPGGLIRALAEVMGEVDRVPKSGRNEFHRYDYATEADIVDAVRGGLAARGIMLVPDVESATYRDVTTKGGTQQVITLTVRFTFYGHGETLSFRIVSEGADALDKAAYKALTGALKYALLKAFLIPTGDDPEADGGSKPAKTAAKPNPRPNEKPAATTPKPAADMEVDRHRKRAFARMAALAWTPDEQRDYCRRLTGRESRADCGVEEWKAINRALDERAADAELDRMVGDANEETQGETP